MLPANQGAEVIRIDPPGDRATAQRLIGSADVAIEHVRPGRMERLGLGHAVPSRVLVCR